MFYFYSAPLPPPWLLLAARPALKPPARTRPRTAMYQSPLCRADDATPHRARGAEAGRDGLPRGPGGRPLRDALPGGRPVTSVEKLGTRSNLPVLKSPSFPRSPNLLVWTMFASGNHRVHVSTLFKILTNFAKFLISSVSHDEYSSTDARKSTLINAAGPSQV